MLSYVQGPAGSGRSRRAIDRLAELPAGLTVVVDPGEGWTAPMVDGIGGEVVVLRRPVACSADLDSVIRVLGAANPNMRVLVDDVEQTCLSDRRWNALASAIAVGGGCLVLVTPEYSSRQEGTTALSTPIAGRRRALFGPANS